MPVPQGLELVPEGLTLNKDDIPPGLTEIPSGLTLDTAPEEKSSIFKSALAKGAEYQFNPLLWAAERYGPSTLETAGKAAIGLGQNVMRMSRGFALNPSPERLKDYEAGISNLEQAKKDTSQFYENAPENIGPEFARPSELSTPERIGTEILGESGPGLAEFAANIPYAAGMGATEAREKGDNPLWGAAKGAVSRWTVGRLLHYANQLKQPVAAVAQGLIFGGQEGISEIQLRSDFKDDLENNGIVKGSPEYNAAWEQFNDQIKQARIKTAGTALAYGFVGGGKKSIKDLTNETIARLQKRLNKAPAGEATAKPEGAMPAEGSTVLPAVPEGLKLVPGEAVQNKPAKPPVYYAEDANLLTPEQQQWGRELDSFLKKSGNTLPPLSPEAKAVVEPSRSGMPSPPPLVETPGIAPLGKSTPEAADRAAQVPAELHANPFLNPKIVTEHVKNSIALLREATDGFARAFYPLSRGESSKQTAYMLGEGIARAERARDVFETGMTEADRLFRNSSKDANIAFMQAADTGAPQATPELQTIADSLQKLWDAKVQQIHEVEPDALQSVRENYFPHMWKKKAGNEAKIEALSRKPMEGSKGFLKQRVHQDVLSGIEAGLEPVSNNPLDLAFMKLIEMDKFIISHSVKKGLKESGLIKFIKAGERPGPEWKRLDDRIFTVFGKPEIGTSEYVDKSIYDGLLKVSNALGIKHERVANAGRGRLGYSVQGGNEIVTQHASETNVIAHEISHQLDYKYNLWDKIAEGGRGNERTPRQAELRKLADLTWEGQEASKSYKQKVRKKAEKMAHLLEAYIHAPEKFKEVAPDTYREFDTFLRSHAELKPLTDIRPGISLKETTATHRLQGYLIKGNYYALDETAQVLNNYLSNTLYSNKYAGKWFKGYMATANELNNWQLGLGSLFHAGFTSFETVISQNALTIRQLWEGRFEDAAKSAVRTPLAWLLNPMEGAKVYKEWHQPGSHPEMAEIVEAMQKAGAYVHPLRAERLQTTHTKKMQEAWAEDKYFKSAWNAIGSVAEKSVAPTLKWLVPRQKLGVFAELYKDYKSSNPNATPEQMQKDLWQKWNRVDARLGQVIYGRMFPQNIAKNLIQAAVRAPGWSGGTIIEVGGGIGDMGKFIAEAAQGRKPKMTDRTAYTLSMVMTTMAINGALTWMLTGDNPKGMDFFAFRTSRVDKNGKNIRFLTPTYMKDLLAYWNAPLTTLLHKTHPLISLLSDIAKNKDYYGQEIAKSEHDTPGKIFDVAKYGAEAFVPFWIRGMKKVSETEQNVVEKGLPFVGVMPAPKWMIQSKSERKIDEIMRGRGTFVSPNPELSQAKREIKQDIRSGKIPASVNAIKKAAEEKGVDLAPQQRRDIIKKSRLTDFADRFGYLSAQEAGKVWNDATDDEKKQVLRIFRAKIANARSITISEKRKLFDKVKEYEKGK